MGGGFTWEQERPAGPRCAHGAEAGVAPVRGLLWGRKGSGVHETGVDSGVLTLSDAQCDTDAGRSRRSPTAADGNPDTGTDSGRAPEPAAATA